MKRLVGWGVPAVISLLTLITIYRAPNGWPSRLKPLLQSVDIYLPWLVMVPLGLALVFSIYFGSVRLSWHTIFFLGLYLYCFHAWLGLPPLFENQPETFSDNGWLVLPYILPLQAWVIDRYLRIDLFSLEGGLILCIFAGEFLGIGILSEVFSNAWGIWFGGITSVTLDWFPFEFPAVSAFLLLMFTLLFFWIRDYDYYDRGRLLLLWIVILGTVSFWPGFEWFGPQNRPYHLVMVGSVQGLLLLAWTFHTAWGKAYLDQLTMVKGRMALDEHLERLSGHYAIVMIDIDDFKDFNDTYGHDSGDIVLRQVAGILDRKSSGEVYRFGGEEFTIVYPGVDAEELEEELEELREAISSNRVKVTKKSARATKRYEKKVTISLGAASPAQKRPDSQSVLNAADEAMYTAKETGRDRWEIVS